MDLRVFRTYSILYLLSKYKDKFKKSLDGRTRLQKMLFLLGEEYGYKLFDYTPYHYGPFSFELRDLLEELKFYGLVVEYFDNYGYYYDITEDGIKYLKSLSESLEKFEELKKEKKKIEKSIDEIIERFGKIPRKQIIEYVYSKYPKYKPEEIKLSW